MTESIAPSRGVIAVVPEFWIILRWKLIVADDYAKIFYGIFLLLGKYSKTENIMAEVQAR